MKTYRISTVTPFFQHFRNKGVFFVTSEDEYSALKLLKEKTEIKTITSRNFRKSVGDFEEVDLIGNKPCVYFRKHGFDNKIIPF